MGGRLLRALRGPALLLALAAPALPFGLARPALGATPAPVTFDFDASAETFDPTFSQDGVHLLLRNDPTRDPMGVVQWLGPGAGPPATPWSGAGHLRLSRTAPGGGAVTADVFLMPAIQAFSLRAFQLDCYEGGRLPAPARCDNPLRIEVYAADGQRLATLVTGNPVEVHPGGPAPGPGDYELLSYAGSEPVSWLRISGDSNRSAFDALVVTPYEYGCGLGFELAAIVPALAHWRRRRRPQRSSSCRRMSA